MLSCIEKKFYNLEDLSWLSMSAMIQRAFFLQGSYHLVSDSKFIGLQHLILYQILFDWF